MVEQAGAPPATGEEGQQYRAFVVEQHGIDLIPEQDRHLTVRGFFMWVGS